MAQRRKKLHIFTSPPDDSQRTLMCALSLGYNCLNIPLFEVDGVAPDYEELVDLIFEYDEVITWW
jgi:hypothetical protein